MNTSHRTEVAILVLLIGLCFALPCLVAQSGAESQATFHANSQLVLLNVTVLDKTGNPVRDLTSRDFQIYEAGEPRSMFSFEPFSEHPLPGLLTEKSIQGSGDVKRLLPDSPLVLLVLDELNTEFGDTAFARNQIKKYLMSQPARLRQPTSFLVCTDIGFRQVHDYTLDRQALLDTLAHLPASYPFQLMQTGGSGEGRSVRFAQTLASLQQIAQANNGHHGRSNILWIGRGFMSIDLRDTTDTDVRALKSATERTVNLLRDSNATLYTIDPTMTSKMGMAPSETAQDNADAFVAEVHNQQDPFQDTISFNTIAPETGGTAIAMSNSIDEQISTSIRDGSEYYSLSFVPSPSIDSEHPFRSINVHVNRPGMTVVTRKGYYSFTPPPPARTARQTLKAAGYDIGTAITSGLSFTGLSVLAGRTLGVPNHYILQVNTGDISWLTEDNGGVTSRLIVVAVSLDAKGKPLNKVAKEINAKLGPEKSLNSIPFTTMDIDLAAVPNARKVRIIVRDMRSGHMGSAEFLTQSNK
jgi:VWFA-related protein